MEASHNVPEQQEQQQELQQDQQEQQDPERKPRRRGRTTLIVAAAALLGLVGGSAVAFKIQADRPPTPLPPLAQQRLSYPAEPLAKGAGRAPLSVKDDSRLRTDGDLRKLLVARPKGAHESELPIYEKGPIPYDHWLSTDEYATEFRDDASLFTEITAAGIRRIAAAGWMQGHRMTGVRLVQFRAGTEMGAADMFQGQADYMAESKYGAGNGGTAVKGSGNARYYLFPVDNEPGYMPSYEARALGWRGDVMVDIVIFDTRPISKKDIRTLAERQLERL